jgi:integrase
MSLKQRGEVWHVCIAAPDGTLIRRSTGTKDRQQAQEFHDKLKAELWRAKKLGERRTRTWDEAAYQWLIETEHKATHKDDAAKIKWLTQHLRGLPLHALTREKILYVTASKQNSTANRYTALVRAIMNKAKKEWLWIDDVPSYFMRKEPERRIRSLTPEQAKVLLNELPEHQRNLATFALCTGLRQSNVKNLHWDDIDLHRRVAQVRKTKNGSPLGVPLNDAAIALLTRIAEVDSEGYVFKFRGKPVKSVSTSAWKNAKARAGITNFRWHDLRHVWATWQVENGTPLFALQEMAGWKSEAMVRRYAHLSVDHLRQYAEVTAQLLHSGNKNGSQENLEPA